MAFRRQPPVLRPAQRPLSNSRVKSTPTLPETVKGQPSISLLISIFPVLGGRRIAMTDAGTNLAAVDSTFDGASGDVVDPDPTELDRLIASLDDLDDLSRSRKAVELVL
jgi:hypothetical protein